MATPAKATPEQEAIRKAALLQAIAQLDIMLSMFGTAPERVQKATKEFKDSLQEWADA